METHGWFRDVSLNGAPLAARDAIAELVRMLDVARQARLDRTSSHARVASGRGASSVEILIAHDTGSDADLTVVVGAVAAIMRGEYRGPGVLQGPTACAVHGYRPSAKGATEQHGQFARLADPTSGRPHQTSVAGLRLLGMTRSRQDVP